MFQVYLLLGANLGKRFEQMQSAFQEIERQIGRVIRYSSLYETTAWGGQGGPDYLNQVVLVETKLAPIMVLEKINKIEKQLGRTRELKWESRLIDIDILYYGDSIIESLHLTVPHPYLHLRKFTLVPLVEIAPNLIHPLLRKSSKTLLEDLKDDSEVRKLE